MQSKKLLQGDCLELMKDIPDGSIDAVITDPPYNISRENHFSSMGRSGIDFGKWDKGFDQVSYLSEVFRVLKKGGTAVIFNSQQNVGLLNQYADEHNLLFKDIIYWVKSNPMPRNRDRRYVTSVENAVTIVKKGEKWIFNRQRSTYENGLFKYPIVSPKERIHPTQKPVQLMEDLVRIHSNENDTILDPFLGSGSTGVACVNTGRNFTGMELDEGCFNKAKDRIEQAKEGSLTVA